MNVNEENRIYFAGPLFTRAEIDFNLKLAEKIRGEGYNVFLPQCECEGLDTSSVYSKCIEGLDNCIFVLAILDGVDSDSGTSFEVGYAKALGIPILGVRTDFRQSCDDGGLNLMLSQGCSKILICTSNDYNDQIINGLNDFIRSIS